MVVSGPVSGLVRVSIALFLLRIAVKRWHRIVLHAIMGTTISITVVYFFVILLQCSPPSNFWQRGPASCDHAQTVGTATLVWGSLSAAMDWMLGVLPIAGEHFLLSFFPCLKLVFKEADRCCCYCLLIPKVVQASVFLSLFICLELLD